MEQVRDGSAIRVRLLLENGQHQFINLALAGVKSPRAMSGRDGESATASEEWGEEVRRRDSRRRARNSHLPHAGQVLHREQAAAACSQGPAAVRARFAGRDAIGLRQRSVVQRTAGSADRHQQHYDWHSVGELRPPKWHAADNTHRSLHPNGNIAEFLLGAGLAKVIDWHVGILSSVGGIDKLRQAEKAAKDKRIGLWENYVAPSAGRPSNGAAANGAAAAAPTTKGQAFDATVVRVWSADQVSVVVKGEAQGKERRVQLASVRGPRCVCESRPAVRG